MLIFKCALIALSSTYIFSLCLQVVKETSSLDTGLAFLYIASGVLAGKIIYDRYQQIHVLSSLTINPSVTAFANKIASFSASFLSLGYLVYLFMFLFKVDDYSLMALTIFIYGFGTLYLWVQCLISTYISTLYYEKNVLVLRQCLANVSFLVLVVMALFGTVKSFLPEDRSSGMYICFVITTLCSYMLAAMFCMFILTFEKDNIYFSEGLRSDMYLDDACSLNNASIEDVSRLVGVQELPNSKVIMGKMSCAKYS